MAKAKKSAGVPKDAAAYRHPTADLPARPEIGTQAHFKKNKPPTFVAVVAEPSVI